ncbi:protein MAIN-LIKE 1-like [Papaver somniferum]|nr:protein MAIN-LIKE 1-like [Papaver somniferum]XP_026421518.1 protein MAIN-LIKE 1-like [Papaver somniferum]
MARKKGKSVLKRSAPLTSLAVLEEGAPTTSVSASTSSVSRRAKRQRNACTDDARVDLGRPLLEGLKDKSLLKSFNTHVASSVWNGQERGALKLHHHGRLLAQWNLEKESQAFRDKVHASGLSSLAKFPYKHVSRPLISAFVERWYPETNTFHLPFGEMTITLDDVKQILNISVKGKAVNEDMVSINEDEAREILSRTLRIDEQKIIDELGVCRGDRVRMKWLMENLAGKQHESEEEIDFAVRGYLLFLLGCTIFTDKTGTKVPVVYMKLLEDLSKVTDYAWGASALAFQYRHLGLASRSSVQQIGGCLTLLEVWIREHFWIGGPIANKDYTEEWPRTAKWIPKVASANADQELICMREELDSLKAEDVTWNPYQASRDHHAFDEIAFYSGCLTAFEVVEPYHPDRVLRQFGRFQRIPSSPFLPVEVCRPKDSNGYVVGFKGKYQYWGCWQDHLLPELERGHFVIRPSDCDAAYMEWYRTVSHPRVQNPDKLSGTQKPSTSGSFDYEDWRHRRERAISLLEESFSLGSNPNVSALLQMRTDLYHILTDKDYMQEKDYMEEEPLLENGDMPLLCNREVEGTRGSDNGIQQGNHEIESNLGSDGRTQEGNHEGEGYLESDVIVMPDQNL